MTGPALTASVLSDLLFEEPGACRCLLDAHGTILRANADWLRAIGLSLHDAIGVDFIELFPGTRDMALARHARARAGHTVAVPRHAQRIQGRETWWEGTISPVPMEDGTGLLVTVREVPPPATSDGRRAKDSLLGTEERLEAIFDRMTEGFALGEAIVDDAGRPRDFRFLEMNNAFELQSGLDREKARGRPMREVLPLIEQSWIDTYCSIALGAPARRFESYNRDLDRHFSVYCFSPEHGRFAIFFTDISDRRRAEQALESALELAEDERRRLAAVLDAKRAAEEALGESTALLQAISDTSSDVIFAKDREGRLRFANPATVALIGKPHAFVIGKTDEELLDDKAAARQVMANDRRIMETGVPDDVEERVPLPDGSERLWFSRKVPYRDASGQVVGLLGISRDITERKRTEETLRESDRRKSEFLAVLSHELRNPLAPIRAGIYLLEHSPPGSVQATRAREAIRRQTDHLTRLVDDLLDVTRISRGKIHLKRERLDLRDVVRKAMDDLRSAFEEAGVELRLQHAVGPVWVDADRTRISQVLGNLLQNSLKFTPDGGAVTVLLSTGGGMASVAVHDTGAGMEPDEVSRMFEPFAQGETGLARTKGGLGLGLSLVKGLVQMHGGTVQGRSEGPHRGAEFILSLPLAEPGVDAVSEEPPAGPAGRVVVLIEDNTDAANMLADVLSLHGHSVRVARDGASGLALARQMRPDVVVCDIGLPDMDGYEVARALRRDGALSGTRLVALSGYAQAEDRERAREAGFDAHIAKPPDAAELMNALGE